MTFFSNPLEKGGTGNTRVTNPRRHRHLREQRDVNDSLRGVEAQRQEGEFSWSRSQGGKGCTWLAGECEGHSGFFSINLIMLSQNNEERTLKKTLLRQSW